MSSDKARPGRSPRRGSPMPRTGFTAFPEQHLFYILLSGHQRSVSAGVQLAPDILAQHSPEHMAMYEKAKWMTRQAREILEGETDEEVTHDDVYRYIRDHTYELEADFEENQ